MGNGNLTANEHEKIIVTENCINMVGNFVDKWGKSNSTGVQFPKNYQIIKEKKLDKYL